VKASEKKPRERKAYELMSRSGLIVEEGARSEDDMRARRSREGAGVRLVEGEVGGGEGGEESEGVVPVGARSAERNDALVVRRNGNGEGGTKL
jgi:hypothetical protein